VKYNPILKKLSYDVAEWDCNEPKISNIIRDSAIAAAHYTER